MLAEFQAALAALKAATDIARGLKGAELSAEKAEGKFKLAELVEKLADAKIEIAAIQVVVFEKDRRIRELEETADIASRLTYEAPYYWLVDGKRREGPYCQQCYDKDKKLIRLQEGVQGFWQCKTCKNNFTDGGYSPPEPSPGGWGKY